ncbi:AsnC family transcriptional regulator [Candidatus Woesearchaeota archaeon]|nr:AsnC family transcriptional regulator [Candidatus Woesearchaeota archaeon]
MVFQRFNEAELNPLKLDTRDLKILSMLSCDARTPLAVLAKETYVSKVAVHNRIKVLEEKGIIQGYAASLDLRMLGYFTYHIFMVINETNDTKKQHLIDFLIKHPNTKNVVEYSDRWDLEWVLIAKDVQEFDTIVIEITNTFADIIVEKHKFEVIYGYKSVNYPILSEYATEKMMLMKHQQNEKSSLDEHDLKIITTLAEHAGASILKIAELTQLTPDIIRYRMKKLEQSSLIRQYASIINLTHLNLHWHTLCVDLKTFNTKNEIKFKEYISTKPQIIRAVKVLGDWDIMMHIVAATIQEVHQITKDFEQNFNDILINYQSFLGFKEHYYTTFPKVLGT